MTEQEKWRTALGGELPGPEAHQKMAPAFRGDPISQEKSLRAAVMVLLYPSNDERHLVFIKRNEYDGPHSGQVSFPGGAWEKGDHSLEETAIRETREEIGVMEKIVVLGALTPLHIPVSNFLVSPFVGWLEKEPKFTPDQVEVQYVIKAPLRELLNPQNSCKERIFHHQQSMEVPIYRVGKEKIWGATAMMLSEALQLASRWQ